MALWKGQGKWGSRYMEKKCLARVWYLPSVVSYNSMILGHRRKGDMDVANSLFLGMMEKSLYPNAIM